MKYVDFSSLTALGEMKIPKSAVVSVETMQSGDGEIYRVWHWPFGMQML